jgi:hypothetical protein
MLRPSDFDRYGLLGNGKPISLKNELDALRRVSRVPSASSYLITPFQTVESLGPFGRVLRVVGPKVPQLAPF